ncbi:hypothetical protein ACFX2F_006598 [Malus domestica]|uniref:50S ribosomal protein L18 n=1 Tax=Malus domestica TaxID=3750 RepID=A0A498IQ66_MALDO|nr:hypothetical protein DVH24_005854 [Malus domestica]
MGDLVGSSRVSSQKQNREGVVGAQSRQYRATVESSSGCGGGPGRDVTSRVTKAKSYVMCYLLLVLLTARDCLRMTVVKRYVLRMFISLKYITANVVDRNNGRIVVSASTVEHSIKGSLECGRSCNAKAGAVVGEVLARRLKVEGLDEGQGRGIHVNVNNEVEKKGFRNRTKIWAIVNALKNNGVKLILDDNDENTSRSG